MGKNLAFCLKRRNYTSKFTPLNETTTIPVPIK